MSNPFLQGLHSPLAQELTLTGEELQVSGHIPADLSGQYVRIGPNPHANSITDPEQYHWFTGDGMVHGICLEAGRARSYRNRWVRSTKVSKALGEAPKPGERFELFDTVNTNVLMHGGRMLALVEAGARPVELDWNLDTIQHSALEGISQAFSAHPHQHPQTGNLHAICYNALDLEQIFHVQLGTDGRVAKTEAIAVQDGPSIHDCTVSENYVVVLDMPVTFNSPMALQGSAFPYRWNPEHPPRVGLLPLDSGADGVLWFDAPSCYIFHTANAYEAQDPVTGNPLVIMDAAVHDGMFQETLTGPEATVTSLQRWTFDLTRLRLSTQVISERYQEFPRINESLTGQQHRYIYSLSQQGRGTEDILSMANAYYKTDTRTGEQQVFDFGPNAVAGEFVFVPSAGRGDRTDSAEEDAGYLMGYVIDAANHHTELVILDARNFNQKQAELARVRVPHVIPPGFHGNWMER